MLCGQPPGLKTLDKLFATGDSVPVKVLLHEVHKNEAHASYWAKKLLNKNLFGAADVFQRTRPYEPVSGGRKRQKLGGSPEHMVTRPAAEHLLKEWKVTK